MTGLYSDLEYSDNAENSSYWARKMAVIQDVNKPTFFPDYLNHFIWG